MRVLVIEDDRKVAAFVQMGLEQEGYAVDVLYEKGVDQTIFDGQWRKHGLSESAYRTKLHDADTAYSQLLTVLTQALGTATQGD